MRRTASVIAASILLSLLVAPMGASADTKSNNRNVANPTKQKIDKVKCKTTRASAQTPARISPPNSIPKRFPRTITLQTNCGDIVIQTFAKQAPVTITVMSTLANGGFFNRTLCHRLTT